MFFKPDNFYFPILKFKISSFDNLISNVSLYISPSTKIYV